MSRVLIFVMALLLPSALAAQEEDKGFVTNFLEENLGGEGRTVSILGFAGALSSRATVDRIIISDDEGVWLTMEDVGLQWNRSALLRGRVQIRELSAASISLERLPVAPESELPPAEASGFSLPELPVSISVDALNIGAVTLGAPVLGEAATVAIAGSAQLGDGEGAMLLNAQRVDGKVGVFDVEGRFVSGTEAVELKLNLSEGPAGIVARLLDLPGQPSLSLTLGGTGTLNDLTTDIALLTDGDPRLEGQIGLKAEEATTAGPGVSRRFTADLGGDVTTLFAPQYRPFFGDNVRLTVGGVRAGDGALDIESLDLSTDALRLNGAVALNRDLWPVVLDVEGELAAQNGAPVLLPLSGPETYVSAANFRLDYDQSDGEQWSGQFDLNGLDREGLQIARTQLTANGILDGDVNAIGKVSAGLRLATEGLDFGDDGLNAAIGATLTGALNVLYVEGQPLKLSRLDVSGADYSVTGDAEVGDLDSGFETTFDVGLEAQNLGRFSELAGQSLGGETSAQLKGTADLGGAFDVRLSGTGTALSVGQPPADAVLAGITRLSGRAIRNEVGLRIEQLDLRNEQVSLTGAAFITSEQINAELDVALVDAGLVAEGIEGPVRVSGTAVQSEDGLNVDVAGTGPYDAAVTAVGLVTGPDAEVAFTAKLPDIKPIVPQYSGAVAVEGTASQSADGWLLDSTMTGPYQLTALVNGRVTGADAPDVRFGARLPDINPLVPQYRGAVRVSGTAKQRSDGLQIATTLEGPYGLRAAVEGRATGENAPDVEFAASLPDVAPLAPQLRGPLNVNGTARMDGEALRVATSATGPYGSTANVSGTLTGGSPNVQFSARLPNIAPLVGQLSGPLSVDGTARQQGTNWFVDTAVQGPAGTAADVVGRVGSDGQLGLNVAGNAPLLLANPFIAPRNVQGQAQFDLRVNGPAALGSVSGQIAVQGGRLSAPTLRAALTDLSANVGISGGRAQIDLTSSVSSGGTLAVRGPVTLAGAYPANLSIDLNAINVVDPSLYRTTLDGQLQVNGNLTGGARIAGRIDVGETRISVPSSGVGGFSIIPQITHVGASTAVRNTQRRAGLLGQTSGPASGPSVSYPLDITIAAPARIFVRGRGLDAELGGNLRLTGTTANLISAGRFELIRGRLDLLEKRFVLDEGSIQLQGSLEPSLRFVATTNTEQGTASVIIEGPASEPQVRFVSSPEAPEDEVLAQIFFGRDATQLSAFQALQLASAVATLAGNGGEGIVSKLRKGFDLDDLDISTDAEGQTALTAGKYISDNVYTDVTVGGADGAEASINVDLTPSITVRGGATARGDTSVGIYFEKDY